MSKEEHQQSYFCEEPWTGIFSVSVDGTVRCCPCFAKVKIGNLHESPISEIWNSPVIVGMREAFANGELPQQCRSELCPVVSGA